MKVIAKAVAMYAPNTKGMKLLSGVLLGSITLNIGQILGFFTEVVHWQLLLAIFLLMGLDFVTAMVKLKVLKIEPTSSGQRKTLSKVSQYGGAITVAYLLWYLFKAHLARAGIMLNLVLLGIIFVEITSIFENLYEADHKSYFGRYFIYPLLKLMKFGMVKNPLMKQLEKIQDQKEDDEKSR